MLFGAATDSGSSFLVFALYLAGLMLILADFSQHKHYLSLIGGFVLAIAMIGILITEGSIYDLFVSVMIATVVIMGTHLTLLYLTKREWIKRYAEKKGDTLIGLEGVTTTTVDGNGHIIIDGTNVLVTSVSPIEQGKKVRIVNIEGAQIFVEEI